MFSNPPAKPKDTFLIVESDRASAEFLKAMLVEAGHNADFTCRPLTPSEANATHIVATLTPRERSVFDRLIEGKSNKLTARELGLSPRTVEFHRARIMSKMKAKSLSDLVRVTLAAEDKAAADLAAQMPPPAALPPMLL